MKGFKFIFLIKGNVDILHFHTPVMIVGVINIFIKPIKILKLK